MSIEKIGYLYAIECDQCNKTEETHFDEFMEAVDWKRDKSNLWLSRKNGNQWEDLCPECNGNTKNDDDALPTKPHPTFDLNGFKCPVCKTDADRPVVSLSGKEIHVECHRLVKKMREISERKE